MLTDLVCNTTTTSGTTVVVEETAAAAASASSSSSSFCLEISSWIGVGVVALLLACVSGWLLIKVFSRFCSCFGYQYGIVGEEHHESNAEDGGGQGRRGASSSTMLFIYMGHGVQTFGDRMWAFAVPIMLIDMYPDSLLPCALYSLGLNFSLIFFTSPVVSWIDKFDRLRVYTVAVWSQNMLILGNCGLVLWLLDIKSEAIACINNQDILPKDDPANQCHSIAIPETLILCGLVVTAVVAQLGSSLSTTCIEKDWIVVLADSNSQLLTQFNTTVRRIDLICKLLAPTAFGILMSLLSNGIYGHMVTGGVVLIASWNLVCLVPQWQMGRCVYYSSARLREPPLYASQHEGKDIERPQDNIGDVNHKSEIEALQSSHENTQDDSETKELSETEREGNTKQITILSTGRSIYKDNIGCSSKMRFFFSHPTFWPVIGYTFHYFSVLNNGVLMVGYLQSQGVNVALIGASSGLGAFFGLLGTVTFPYIKDRLCGNSLLRSGSVSTWLFFLTIFPAATAFYFPVSILMRGYIIIVSISVARIWLWAFDLAHVQVLQEMTESGAIGFINGYQTSTYQFFYVCQSAAALIWDNPDDFNILAAFSLCTVFLGAIFWSRWAWKNNNADLKLSDGASNDDSDENSEDLFDDAAQLDHKERQTLAILQQFRSQLIKESTDDENTEVDNDNDNEKSSNAGEEEEEEEEQQQQQAAAAEEEEAQEEEAQEAQEVQEKEHQKNDSLRVKKNEAGNIEYQNTGTDDAPANPKTPLSTVTTDKKGQSF